MVGKVLPAQALGRWAYMLESVSSCELESASDRDVETEDAMTRI